MPSSLPLFVPLLCYANPDINELNLPKTCDISFSDPDDLLNFKLVICPDEVRAHEIGLPGIAWGGSGWRGHLELGDLVHLPGPAGWCPNTFLFSSQGFYKSGKFVFSFKVSVRWAGMASWLRRQQLRPQPGTAGAPIYFLSLFGARWARVTHMTPPR